MMYSSFEDNRMRSAGVISIVLAGALILTVAGKSRLPVHVASDRSIRDGMSRVMSQANLALEAMAYKVRMNGVQGMLAEATGKGPTIGAPESSGPLAEMPDMSANVPAVPVLLYHGVITHADGVNITTDTLWNQLYALRQEGYYTVTLQQFEDYLQGKIVLTGKPFLLTFDDGRNDSYYNADPIIHALGWNAVMFVISGRIDHSSFSLDSTDIKAMQASGRWDIESHTRFGHDASYPVGSGGEVGDFYSNRLYLASAGRLETFQEYSARVGGDVSGVKSDIENLLHKPVTAFAYPFGDYGQESVNYPGVTAVLLGIMSRYYQISFYQALSDQGPIYNYPLSVYDQHTSPILARRIEPKASWNGRDLTAYLDTVSPKLLPFSDDFSTNHGWITSWGKVSSGHSLLVLSSTASTTGSSAVLQGSHGWQDYIMNVKSDWTSSQSITLYARFADEHNSVGCNFSVGGVRIRETKGGVEKQVIETKLPVPMKKQGSDLGIAVKGTRVACYLDGKVVSKAVYANSAAPMGGVALSVWSPAKNAARGIVTNLTVTPL